MSYNFKVGDVVVLRAPPFMAQVNGHTGVVVESDAGDDFWGVLLFETALHNKAMPDGKWYLRPNQMEKLNDPDL